MQPKKPNKYRNKPVIIDGIRFDSTLEANYYGKLKLKERACLIAFERQVDYPIIVNGLKVTTYRADFVVTDRVTGKIQVIDCKGYRTPEYRIKRALMLAVHGIEIVEITN